MTNTSFLFPKITFIPYITHSSKVHLMFFFLGEQDLMYFIQMENFINYESTFFFL